MPETESAELLEIPLAPVKTRKDIVTRKVALGAVFGALSAAFSFVAAYLPRYPGWGIAFFDPVSVFWIIAFLVGGYEVGLLSITTGTVTLFLWDPTGIGPIFKFLATISFIVVPWFGIRLSKEGGGGSLLSSRSTYAVLMLIAYIVRLFIMIPLNLVFVPLWSPEIGFLEIILITSFLNGTQSFGDALVPYLVVYKAKVFEQFGMW